MKKKILVGMVLTGLIVSSMVILAGKHGVFARGSTTPTQSAVTATVNDEETADSNIQEPNYIGSIKVTDTNTKDEVSESTAFQGLAKISQTDAETSALAKVQGTVVKTGLENENGYLVYAVSIKDAQGKIIEVKIDAGNGSVLTVEASDSAEEEGLEKKGEEVSKGPDTDTVQEEVNQED